MVAPGKEFSKSLQNTYVQLKLSKNYSVRVGQFRGPFLMEDRISSRYTQAIDRSVVSKNFSLGFVRGISVRGQFDRWRFFNTVHLGRESRWGKKTLTSFAMSSRFEYLVFGRKKDMKDYAAWSRNRAGLRLGMGTDFEKMLGNSNISNHFSTTADLMLKLPPVNFLTAFILRYAEIEGDPNPTQLGFMSTLGMFIVKDFLDVFCRLESIKHSGYNELGNVLEAKFKPNFTWVTLYSVGLNAYLREHDMKLSSDFTWVPNGLVKKEKSLDLFGEEPGIQQKVVRIQWQILL